MVMTGESTVQWASPSPLWPELVQNTSGTVDQAFLAPAILRFASDSFMDEFMGLLNTTPGRLGERRVMPETWREPIPLPAPLPELPLPTRALPRSVARSSVFGAGSTAPALTGTASGPLKLYQAAHLRFYLVCACLVCRVPGLPDRTLNIPAQEQVGFVMRRLQPRVDGTIPDTQDPGSYDEFAFVPAPQGSTWQQVGGDSAIMPGEELIPLFPVTFSGEDGRKRRLLSGLIPVGKREAYLGAPLVAAPGTGGSANAPSSPFLGLRETLLNMQVVPPWSNLSQLQEPSQSNQVQMISWYILLDLASYIEKYLPNIWQVMTGQQQANTLNDAEQKLLALLNNRVESTSGVALAQALVTIAKDTNKNKLETVLDPYIPGSTEWPDFLYNLADANLTPIVNQPDDETEAQSKLEQLIEAALPPDHTGATLSSLGQPKPEDKGNPTWFVIRCVFERPNCGPLKPPVVSPPTQVFKLAAFFDPDAPGRPIRISLPLDTSIAGLRKFNKNVTFVISDQLNKQMQSVSNLQGVIQGNISPGSGVIGQICSFSIPIITICAFMVLFIFLILLNIVFFWLPLFKICFPLPNLKTKGE